MLNGHYGNYGPYYHSYRRRNIAIGAIENLMYQYGYLKNRIYFTNTAQLMEPNVLKGLISMAFKNKNCYSPTHPQRNSIQLKQGWSNIIIGWNTPLLKPPPPPHTLYKQL